MRKSTATAKVKGAREGAKARVVAKKNKGIAKVWVGGWGADHECLFADQALLPHGQSPVGAAGLSGFCSSYSGFAPPRASPWGPLMAVFLVMALMVLGVGDAGAFSLLEGEKLQLELTGYVQSASGFQDPGYEVPGALVGSGAVDAGKQSLENGFNEQVLRLQWTAQWKQLLVLEVHNLFYSQMNTTETGAEMAGLGTIAGLGATAMPAGVLDLRTVILDRNGFLLTHDIDRLAVRAFLSKGELVVGRQAITWGDSVLFRIADVWAQFSPYELDQTQKRGIDAVRALYYPVGGTSIELIVADRGAIEDLSIGALVSMSGGSTDVYVAGGKFWDVLEGMVGVTYEFSKTKARVEVVQGFEPDVRRFRLPRATVGGDYLSNDWSFTAEYHFNGLGASGADGYAAQLESPVFARGESYYLGQQYFGVAGSYGGVDRLRVFLSVVTNIGDPSVIVSPSAQYELSDNSDITFGAFQGIGSKPEFFDGTVGGGASLETPLVLGSEFGTYGGFYYVQFRGFF